MKFAVNCGKGQILRPQKTTMTVQCLIETRSVIAHLRSPAYFFTAFIFVCIIKDVLVLWCTASTACASQRMKMLFQFLMFLVWKKETVSLWHILGPLHIFNGTVLQMFQNKRTAANWFNVIKISTYYSRSI